MESIGEDDQKTSFNKNVLGNISKISTMGLESQTKPGNNELLKQIKFYGCTKCSKTVCECSNESLTREQTKDNPFKCPICTYSSRLSEDLRAHFMTTHAESKSYNCTLCAFSATWSGGLKQHRKAHHESEPYRCTFCPYWNKYEDGLMMHMKKHGNIRFKCSLCSLTSIWPTNIRRHMITHSQSKPYKCNLCKFSTKHASSLRRHVKKHRENKPY